MAASSGSSGPQLGGQGPGHASGRFGPARRIGHCWVLMVNSTAPGRGARRTSVWRSLRSQTRSRPDTSGANESGDSWRLGARTGRRGCGSTGCAAARAGRRAAGRRTVSTLALELGRRSGGPGRGWRPASGPACRASRQCEGKQSDAASSRYVAVGWTPCRHRSSCTRRPARVQRVQALDVAPAVCAGPARSVGGQPGLDQLEHLRAGGLGTRDGRRRPRRGRSVSSAVLQGQLVGRSGRRRTSQSSRSRGCTPIDSQGGPGFSGQFGHPGWRLGGLGRVHPTSMGDPGLEVRRRCRYALPLVRDGPGGPAPHGPDRISTDVCAGQCSLGTLGPRSPTSTGAPPGFPSGALA